MSIDVALIQTSVCRHVHCVVISQCHCHGFCMQLLITSELLILHIFKQVSGGF